MIFSRIYILIMIVTFVILLLSYYFILNNSSHIDIMWGNIKGNLLLFYYFSILLTWIGLVLLGYYLFNAKSFTPYDENHIFFGIMSMFIISIFWTPLTIHYLKSNSYKSLFKYLIILILLLVSLSAMYVTYILFMIKENSVSRNLALTGMIYYSFHAFFLDTILWSFKFF